MLTKVKFDQDGFASEIKATGTLRPQTAFSTHRTHKMPPINQAKANSGIIFKQVLSGEPKESMPKQQEESMGDCY